MLYNNLAPISVYIPLRPLFPENKPYLTSLHTIQNFTNLRNRVLQSKSELPSVPSVCRKLRRVNDVCALPRDCARECTNNVTWLFCASASVRIIVREWFFEVSQDLFISGPLW